MDEKHKHLKMINNFRYTKKSEKRKIENYKKEIEELCKEFPLCEDL